MAKNKKKRKKASLAPRRKRMKREGRLSNAKSTEWVASYSGKDIIRGYRKWYGVDGLTAVLELRCLGVLISPVREAQVRTTVEQKAKKTAERKAAAVDDEMDRDEDFNFIDGYTAGGAPYGDGPFFGEG